MTVKCITCNRFALRGCDLAPHGFGHCALRPKHENYPAERARDCAHHQPADADKVASRRAWLSKMEQRRRGENRGP